MGRELQQKKYVLIIAFIGIAAFFSQIGLVPSVSADSMINVKCYLENSEGFGFVGTTDVWDASGAAQVCNRVYRKCDKQCIGCVFDHNGKEICYDNSGNKFEK